MSAPAEEKNGTLQERSIGKAAPRGRACNTAAGAAGLGPAEGGRQLEAQPRRGGRSRSGPGYVRARAPRARARLRVLGVCPSSLRLPRPPGLGLAFQLFQLPVRCVWNRFQGYESLLCACPADLRCEERVSSSGSPHGQGHQAHVETNF